MAQAPAEAPQPKSSSNGAGGGGRARAAAHGGFWALVLGSIGVVYGDIGTSPLYAFKESLAPRSARRHARDA
jgi:KUP system potassium uptake protein